MGKSIKSSEISKIIKKGKIEEIDMLFLHGILEYEKISNKNKVKESIGIYHPFKVAERMMEKVSNAEVKRFFKDNRKNYDYLECIDRAMIMGPEDFDWAQRMGMLLYYEERVGDVKEKILKTLSD